MADITITAASVLAGENSNQKTGLAGEALTAGKVVYLDGATNTFKLADNNAAAALRDAYGVALNGAAAGQPVAVHRSGDLTLGAVLTPGVAYYLSDTPGGVCPVADLASGEYVVLLGLAKSASVLAVDIQASGTAN
ncbi:MAG: hypothetical protein EON87_08700 [Brevundimonas sp.]|nr:MAG: hypothetical protein EON87_08700 [Brevundimonas sp.]